jgi:hypothetical protein
MKSRSSVKSTEVLMKRKSAEERVQNVLNKRSTLFACSERRLQSVVAKILMPISTRRLAPTYCISSNTRYNWESLTKKRAPFWTVPIIMDSSFTSLTNLMTSLLTHEGPDGVLIVPLSSPQCRNRKQ